MSLFRLAHFSDPHLPPPDGALGLKDLASKRLLSGFAWRRKGREHDRAVLDALVADVRAYEPDHIAVTGDLTNFSTPAEFARAKAWLESLGPADKVTVSPGNHDALVGAGAAPLSTWRPWFGDPGAQDFPYLRIRGQVAIVNCSSAVPTAPHRATGVLGEDQLARLEATLRSLAGRDLARVLTIHHPPAEGVVSRRKSLEDAAELRGVLAVHGVDLILHGHGHEPAVSRVPGPDGDIPALGVPSASAVVGGHHPPARWHAIEIGREQGKTQIRVSARGLDGAGAFVPMGAYRLAA